MSQASLPNREGQLVPAVTFRLRRNGEWATLTTDDIFAGKNVVVFSLPGAFTPTCSSTHCRASTSSRLYSTNRGSTKSSAFRSTTRS
jgi:peroxiredoxin